MGQLTFFSLKLRDHPFSPLTQVIQCVPFVRIEESVWRFKCTPSLVLEKLRKCTIIVVELVLSTSEMNNLLRTGYSAS